MLRTGYNLTKEEIIKKYNALTQRRGLGEEFNQRVISIAGDLSNKRILDAGCGYGELLIEIAKRCPSSHLYGVDLSSTRIKETSVKLGKIAIKSGDIQEKIPFEDNFFDFVFCTETIEHLKNPDYCLREIKRVLINNGRIIITIPNATGYWPFCYLNYLDCLIPTRWLKSKLLPYEHPLNTDQPIDTCYSYKEIVELICRNGLQIKKIGGWRYFRYLQTLPLIRDIYKILYPFVEWFLPKIKMERFAYNLFLLCRTGR